MLNSYVMATPIRRKLASAWLLAMFVLLAVYVDLALAQGPVPWPSGLDGIPLENAYCSPEAEQCWPDPGTCHAGSFACSAPNNCTPSPCVWQKVLNLRPWGRCWALTYAKCTEFSTYFCVRIQMYEPLGGANCGTAKCQVFTGRAIACEPPP